MKGSDHPVTRDYRQGAPSLRIVLCAAVALVASYLCGVPDRARAEEVRIVKNDYTIDALDPGIKLFVREKMADGNARFADDNIVVFLHGATSPASCDFDLQYKDYSWADWLVRHGFVVYMVDYRNYGGSTREKAMDEPPAANKPLTRSYLALRDIEALVNHVKTKRRVRQVSLIGWSWGAMMAGYYASLHSENVHRLVLYAPLYDFPYHTNLGAGSALQDKRHPLAFNFALGAYRYASEAANTKRWNGEIPVADKDEYRDPAVPAAFWNQCLATDPTSNTRNPPSLRAPNGVLEDSFYQATGRPLWNAANIYAPTLVIGGNYDTWSFIEDREGLMRDLVHAAAKKMVTIKDATHFVIFEKHRMQLFEAVLDFLKN